MITTAEFGGVASAQGIDVSNFQGRYDWGGAKRSTPQLAFGIFRVTQGLGQGVNSPDPDAAWNHQQTAAHGLARGGYHFLDPNLDGGQQARYFVSTWDKLGLAPRDMLWLDNEDNKGGTAPAARIAGCAQAFMAELHALLPHNPIGVYSNLNFGQTGADAGLGRWPWWAAHPGGAPVPPPPWTSWTFWQWGIRNGVDADAFNGTITQLEHWLDSFGAAPPQPKHPPQPTGGPVRRLTTGHLSLNDLAKERNTTPAHLFDMSAHHYSARDIQTIAALPLPQGTPYYTTN